MAASDVLIQSLVTSVACPDRLAASAEFNDTVKAPQHAFSIVTVATITYSCHRLEFSHTGVVGVSACIVAAELSRTWVVCIVRSAVSAQTYCAVQALHDSDGSPELSTAVALV